MKITILAVGTRLPNWINQGVAEYSKRFPPEVKVEINEIQADKRSKSSTPEKTLKAEAGRISAAITKGSHLIVLDERGKKQGTTALAKNMESWMLEGKNIVFVIGGADGIYEDIKDTAQELWALSDFTLPHGLARVLLIEQLYRVWTVIRKHPYHRE
jgi:23S rRNA (pseudouridine1915-N3)-methyltransferase